MILEVPSMGPKPCYDSMKSHALNEDRGLCDRIENHPAMFCKREKVFLRSF